MRARPPAADYRTLITPPIALGSAYALDTRLRGIPPVAGRRI